MNAVFDFGAFPPEVNSAKMYAGPGSTSLLSAAAAWKGLAAELRSQAANYTSIVSNLTGDGWRGAASTAMAAAAAPYTAWMNTTAAQAEQTANQAMAAAAAYEGAFGMTVPPPVIAANRTQLASLVATNLLGQNGPAIAATEAHYGRNVGARRRRHVRLCRTIGSSDQGAIVHHCAADHHARRRWPAKSAATTQATGTSTQASLSQLTATVPTTLQGLASPATSTPSSAS